MYDLIGDVHGNFDALQRLMIQMDYRACRDGFVHPDRQAIFLGDLINRGEAVHEVVKTVRRMERSGGARVIMGNHELNFLAFYIRKPGKKRSYLRQRTRKNRKQLAATHAVLSKKKLEKLGQWIRGLPLYVDLPGLRVVHACWDPRAIKRIDKGLQKFGGVTDEFMYRATDLSKKLGRAVECTLKGKEQRLPRGRQFKDVDGFDRGAVRVRWFLPPDNLTYREFALTRDELPDLPLPPVLDAESVPYPLNSKPVFMGHYCLRPDPEPDLLAPNVACLDYGVARDDLLCAYRWDGEQVLKRDRFVWVTAH